MAEGALNGIKCTIRNKNSGLALDHHEDDEFICQQECFRDERQTFYLAHVEGNIYYIRCKSKALTLVNDRNGEEVRQSRFDRQRNQQWCLEECGDGSWKIMSAFGAKRHLDIPGNSREKGCKVVAWTGNDGDNQRFYLESKGSKGLSEGNLNGNVVILEDTSSDTWGVIQARKYGVWQTKFDGGLFQRFILVHVKENVYHLINMGNGLALYVPNEDFPDIQIHQNEFTGSRQQQWALEVDAIGKWRFKSCFRDGYLSGDLSGKDGGLLLLTNAKHRDPTQQSFWMLIAGFEGYFVAEKHTSIMRLHGEALSIAHESGNRGAVLVAGCSSPESTGTGRVVACGHAAYIDKEKHGLFLLSMVRWASQDDQQFQYTVIDKKGDISKLPKNPVGHVVVAKSDDLRDEDIPTIKHHVEKGGGLIVAQTSGDYDTPINKYLSEIGIFFNGKETLETSKGLAKTAPSKSKLATFPHYLLDVKILAENGAILEALNDLPENVTKPHQKLIREALGQLAEMDHNVFPSASNPIWTHSPSWPIFKFLNTVHVNNTYPNLKAPGIEIFPGDVPPTAIGINHDMLISSDINYTFHPTGFYLKAGETLKGKVLAHSGLIKFGIIIQYSNEFKPSQ